MTTATLDQYLNTSYEPDRDFVDGVLVERHVGSQRQGLFQAALAMFFGRFMKSHRIAVFIATRLQVDAATGRHRVPDLMVVELPVRLGKVVTDVPPLVVEIKSPEDTFDDIMDRCFDYERLAVRNIVVMDPDKKRAWMFRDGTLNFITATIWLELGDGIQFPASQLFAEVE
jgi:Uma2 family endonuclease